MLISVDKNVEIYIREFAKIHRSGRFVEMTHAPDMQYFVSSKMEELFMEWIDLPSTQKLIRRVINLANGGMTTDTHIMCQFFHRFPTRKID